MKTNCHNDLSLYLLGDSRFMPQTLFEKLWDRHLIGMDETGESLLYVDRVCMHERTGSIAMQSLMERGLPVRRPKQAFCVMDHTVDTYPGRGDQTRIPGGEAFIVSARSSAQSLGLTLFDVNDADQGISHLVSAEQGFALPGISLVCPDSHTCTLGAVGALALGVGASQVEHALATSCIRLSKPNVMRVTFEGQLAPWVTAKDMVLHLIAEEGAAAARGAAVEYGGSTVESLPVEARMTLCNMAVEFSAFTGLIAPDEKTFAYVEGRPHAPVPLPREEWQSLRSDADAEFMREIRIDASTIRPRVTWGTSPEHGVSIHDSVPEPTNADAERALGYMGLEPGLRMKDLAVDAAFIGSCTNSRLSDLRAAANILRNRRVARGVAAVCVPGSTGVKRAAEAEGIDRIFLDAGFEWRESGCSMCFYAGGETFGPGKRVITSTNRNFEGRQGPGVRSHLASPELVAASAIRGTISSPDMLT